MPRHVFLSDFDGFLYFHGEDENPEQGSAYRKPLIDFWVKQILSHDTIQDAEIVVGSFSARAYGVRAEVDNAIRNETPLSLAFLEHRVLPELMTVLSENGFANNKTKFDPITLADFYPKFSPGKTAQLLKSLFDKQGALRKSILQQQEPLFHCSSKLPLLYFLTHYYGQDGKETIIYVGDDRFDILAFIEAVVSQYPEILPANVKFVPYRYTPSITANPADVFSDFSRGSIQGTGSVNPLLNELLNPAYMQRFTVIDQRFAGISGVATVTKLLEDTLEKIVVNFIHNADDFLEILAFINHACDLLQNKHERFRSGSFQKKLACFFLVFSLLDNQDLKSLVNICLSNITTEAIDEQVVVLNELTSSHDEIKQIVGLLDTITAGGGCQSACVESLIVLSLKFFKAIEESKANRCKVESLRIAGEVAQQLKKATIDAGIYILFRGLKIIKNILLHLCARLQLTLDKFIYSPAISYINELLADDFEGLCKKSQGQMFFSQMVIRLAAFKINLASFIPTTVSTAKEPSLVERINSLFEHSIDLIKQLQDYSSGLQAPAYQVSTSSMPPAIPATLQTTAVSSLLRLVPAGHAGSAGSQDIPLTTSSRINLPHLQSDFGASGQKCGKS